MININAVLVMFYIIYAVNISEILSFCFAVLYLVVSRTFRACLVAIAFLRKVIVFTALKTSGYFDVVVPVTNVPT